MLKFPKNFIWGVATSAHQVEGDNKTNDWWEWEMSGKGTDKSGIACNHYKLYEEDFDILEKLNVKAYRFSIEWSRIEPSEGKFSKEAISHYKKMIVSLRKRGIEPIVTLHHFTNPIWFTKKDGWENKKAGEQFIKYVEFTVNNLCELVTYWVTINEPAVYTRNSYLLGDWPPQKKSLGTAYKVIKILQSTHCSAYKKIHKIYNKKNLSSPKVSIAKHVPYFESIDNKLKNRLAAKLRSWIFNNWTLDFLVRKKTLDFIGINYYLRRIISTKKWTFKSILMDVYEAKNKYTKNNSLGWDMYPKGLFRLLQSFKKYKLPIFILENGISTDNDKNRIEFLNDHLKIIHQAIDENIPLIGYTYWSFMDNFEWDKGFKPRFGLVEIDYPTQKRKIRESGKFYSEICKNNYLK